MSFVSVDQILCVHPFTFGIEGGLWDVIVLIPDRILYWGSSGAMVLGKN